MTSIRLYAFVGAFTVIGCGSSSPATTTEEPPVQASTGGGEGSTPLHGSLNNVALENPQVSFKSYANGLWGLEVADGMALVALGISAPAAGTVIDSAPVGSGDVLYTDTTGANLGTSSVTLSLSIAEVATCGARTDEWTTAGPALGSLSIRIVGADGAESVIEGNFEGSVRCAPTPME